MSDRELKQTIQLSIGAVEITASTQAELENEAHCVRLWDGYVRTGHKPSNIPARPDLVYPEWVSWADWIEDKSSQGSY